ncbi:MAG: 50S ribosomal protein L25/general stress protein Ctc [Pseudomonadota bacterium]|nr:50S ribosomal protein L25/general stress protein Ctc [Pseudomonadota bacterium]
MSEQTKMQAETRDRTGTGAMRRMRREGKVPAVLYGAGKENVNLALDHLSLLRNLEVESFNSAILSIVTDGKEEQAILRDLQMHPYKPAVLHADFQRVSAKQALTITVPLHFTNEEECPGVKIDGGILSHLMTAIEISCLPKDLPEYLDLDVEELGMNQALHLSDIKMPEGVEIVSLASGGEDQSVVSVLPPQAEVEEEEVEAEEIEGEEGEEGAEGAEEAEAEESSDKE